MNTLTITVVPNQPAFGNTVTLEVVLRVDDMVTDPSSMTLGVTDPSPHTTIYAWPTAGPNILLTRVTVGTFRAVVPITETGVWGIDWESLGPDFGIASTFLVPPILETVTFTTQTVTPTPIPGAYIAVYEGAEHLVVAGYSDASGNMVRQLLPGAYDIQVSLVKTLFPNLVSLTVLNNSTPQTCVITGTPLAITTTAGVAPTRLFGQVINLSGINAQWMRVEIEQCVAGDTPNFLEPTFGTDTGVSPISLMLMGEKRELLTDENGYWEANVVQGTQVRVSIPDIHLSRVVRIPLAINNPTFPLLAFADARVDINGPPLGLDRDTGSVDF